VDPRDGAQWDAGGHPEIRVDWAHGARRGRAFCGQDQLACDLSESIDVDALSSSQPLVLRFTDVDPFSDDGAGRLDLTDLSGLAGEPLTRTSDTHVDITVELEPLGPGGRVM
jgi:hypothetical protein